MYRFAIEKLKEWKRRENKKPLILYGARQVGKTWLMKEFGKECFSDTVYLNFDISPQYGNIFGKDIDPDRIIRDLEIRFNKTIGKDTLVIFDEIQEVPRALTSLKYFNELRPDINIVCAGSLLGMALHPDTSFPVGKVNSLSIYPMNFSEFLIATGREKLAETIETYDWQLITDIKDLYIQALKEYYFIGGMPEAVNSYTEDGNFENVRNIHKEILINYDRDFSKHTGDTCERVREVWRTIPAELAKEHKKFVYGLIREGARAKEYETAINWLEDCGLVYKISNITVPKIPMNAYKDFKAFKLYLSDIGLLGCMSGAEALDIIENDRLLTEFKGALTEQYVCQELKSAGYDFTYYHNNSYEIDFTVRTDKGIVPVEVKANINLQAKSLKIYRAKYEPEKAVRTSLADYKVTDNLYDIPLYAICKLREILNS